MKLYKNVDIKDLQSILEKGIISIDAGAPNNLDDGKRAKNATNVVYLFEPIGKVNTFPHYGIALLEVDCSATVNEFMENDIHKNDYIEYITDYVSPGQIKAIYIPEIFRDRLADISLPDMVKYVPMTADLWDNGKRPATQSELEQFGKTAELNSTWYGFFRGKDAKRNVIDLYDVCYILG